MAQRRKNTSITMRRMTNTQSWFYNCLYSNEYLVTKEERQLAASAMAAAINWAASIDRQNALKKRKIL